MRRELFVDPEDLQQKFKMTNTGFISCSQTHGPFLEFCPLKVPSERGGPILQGSHQTLLNLFL